MTDVSTGGKSELSKQNEPMASLHDVSDLKVTSHSNIGDARVTSAAYSVLHQDAEEMLWQDAPSPSLMIPSLLKWGLILAICAAALVVLRPMLSSIRPAEPAPATQEVAEEKATKGKKGQPTKKPTVSQTVTTEVAEQTSAPDNSVAQYAVYAGLMLLGYQLWRHAHWYLQLKNIRYKMSSQRLVIESGILSKSINAYELHQLQNGQVYRPWNLRLFGRENLYVSGLWLLGIKNAEVVRDLIRNGGQIEASRIDKARFR